MIENKDGTTEYESTAEWLDELSDKKELLYHTIGFASLMLVLFRINPHGAWWMLATLVYGVISDMVFTGEDR